MKKKALKWLENVSRFQQTGDYNHLFYGIIGRDERDSEEEWQLEKTLIMEEGVGGWLKKLWKAAKKAVKKGAKKLVKHIGHHIFKKVFGH